MNLHRFADLLTWLVKNDHGWAVVVLGIVASIGIAYLVWS